MFTIDALIYKASNYMLIATITALLACALLMMAVNQITTNLPYEYSSMPDLYFPAVNALTLLTSLSLITLAIGGIYAYAIKAMVMRREAVSNGPFVLIISLVAIGVALDMAVLFLLISKIGFSTMTSRLMAGTCMLYTSIALGALSCITAGLSARIVSKMRERPRTPRPRRQPPPPPPPPPGF